MASWWPLFYLKTVRVTVTLEEEGNRLAPAHTDAAGKASLAVPRVRCFDLRIRGGWAIPVLLSFRT